MPQQSFTNIPAPAKASNALGPPLMTEYDTPIDFNPGDSSKSIEEVENGAGNLSNILLDEPVVTSRELLSYYCEYREGSSGLSVNPSLMPTPIIQYIIMVTMSAFFLAFFALSLHELIL
jgi:hypothetical protein